MLRTTGRPNFRRSRFKKPTQEAYGKDWATLSEYIRRRDNYTCLAHKIGMPKCGNRFPPPFHGLLHPHHIVPLPRGSNHPTNLVTLCKDCHGKHHGKSFGKAISTKQKQAAKRGFRCT